MILLPMCYLLYIEYKVVKGANMGAMKDRMIEIMNSEWEQDYVSSARPKCPESGEEFQTDVPVCEPNLMAEKSSDMTVGCEIEIECTECGKVYEGYAYAGPFHCDISLNNYPDLEIYSEAPYYTNYDLEEYFLPESPLDSFKNTINELRDLLGQNSYEESTNLINRMIFSQSVAAFEAYFCDTLIKTIISEPELMHKAITVDQQLSGVSYKLKDILEHSDLVENSIKTSLKNRLYHDIKKVSRWYSNILDIKISPNKEAFLSMEKAVLDRHDCVHRNGKDKNENPLSHITKSHVLETLNLIESFVDNTKKQIDDLNVKFLKAKLG